MRVLAGGIQDLQVSILDWGAQVPVCLFLHRGDSHGGVRACVTADAEMGAIPPAREA